MNYATKILAALALALGLSSAHAYTTCSATTVAKIFQEVVSGTTHTYILLTSGVGIDIASNAANYKEVISLAQGAKMAGITVDVNFVASGVSCTTASYRTDLQNFYLN